MVDICYCAIFWISFSLIHGNCFDLPFELDRELFKKPEPENNGENRNLPQDEWMNQKLDHFDLTNRKTWKQRYFVNKKYYKIGSPVFLRVFGESEANPVWLINSALVEYAADLDAMIIGIEHRYYGKSHPTEDLSVQNLEYLTSEQALGDLAIFRNYIVEKMKLPTETKWIAFGGSYSGSLAAWFRLKYPHLVHASVSTSAALYAVSDFKQYLEGVKNSLDTTGPSCSQRISEATEALNNLMKNDSGILYVKKLFKVCSILSLRNKDDVKSFFRSLMSTFMYVVQYNKEYGKITTNTLCSIMNNRTIGLPLERYAKINSMFMKIRKTPCLRFSYSNLIYYLKQTSWSSWAAKNRRQWLYQKCNEFDFFKSTDSEKQPFGHRVPAEFLIKKCGDVFGDDFNATRVKESVERTNTFYGGKKMKVKRVMFINGSLDPWKALSITKSLSKEAPALVINGTAHCANMLPSHSRDLQQLTAARKAILSQISKWLED